MSYKTSFKKNTFFDNKKQQKKNWKVKKKKNKMTIKRKIIVDNQIIINYLNDTSNCSQLH